MTINGNTACYWAMGSGYNPCRQTVVQFREGTYSFRKLDFGFRQGAATHDQLLVRDGGDVTFDYIMNGYTSSPDTATITPNSAGGTNVITVTGTGSKLTMRNYMYNEHNGKGTVILNVTDGAVYTSPITSNYLSKERGIFQRFFINVDGATMALTGKDGYAKGGKGSTNYWVTAFTVMEHGATFDTSGATGAKYLQGPIVHPRPGRRVKSIPLPTDSAFTKARHYPEFGHHQGRLRRGRERIPHRERKHDIRDERPPHLVRFRIRSERSAHGDVLHQRQPVRDVHV